MTEARSSYTAELIFPEDLRTWIGAEELIELLFEALHRAERLSAWSNERGLAPGAPRMLLTLLTYSYAVGLYDSEEIERRSATDLSLVYLCARNSPTSSTLRRFRRFHRLYLRRTLSQLLQLVYERHLRPASAMAPCSRCPCGNDLTFGVETLCQHVAEGRIDQAVLADSMALDN